MSFVKIEDDFDLRKIAESGQCFRFHETGDGGYRIQAGDRELVIRPLSPERYEVSEWDPFWENYFDLATDYTGIRRKISEDDPYLCAAAEAGQGIRILRQDPWETLITFIISQRKSIPAIKGCVEKLCEAAGRNHSAFPTREELASLTMDELKSCGLGYRAKYIAAVAAGDLDMDFMARLGDEQLKKELMLLPGVGIKVASCTMLFGFHRMNLFPEDVWINRVLAEHYPDGFPFARYAPYCGVMQQYLFYYRRNIAK